MNYKHIQMYTISNQTDRNYFAVDDFFELQNIVNI